MLPAWGKPAASPVLDVLPVIRGYILSFRYWLGPVLDAKTRLQPRPTSFLAVSRPLPEHRGRDDQETHYYDFLFYIWSHHSCPSLSCQREFMLMFDATNRSL